MVVKTSREEQKLIDEIQWYLNLPKSIRKFTPGVQEYSVSNGNVYLQLDYLPYPTLSELLVKNSIELSEWELIFIKIKLLLELFDKHFIEASTSDLVYMYVEKTHQRLSTYIKQNSIAREYHSKGFFMLNGRKVKCPLRLFEETIHNFINSMNNPVNFNIIHGDLCCSNILYDRTRNHIYLIDPRGSFGRRGIHGDRRYDLAKMRHSFSGYDFIIHDLGAVRCSTSYLDFQLPSFLYLKRLALRWDSICETELENIRLIEALLFLSMLPLHQDQPLRQLIMYGLGTKLLHDALRI